MSHPETILRTLDRHLEGPTRLILYGRAALALGFPGTAEFELTLDVDAILPSSEMESIEQNDRFWTALDRTNVELEPQGLYITHLFTEDQVILSDDWLEHLVRIDSQTARHLQLYRPSTGDLILTKMMRIDPQDRMDIQYLLAHGSHSDRSMTDYLRRARVPRIPEIQDAFAVNQTWLLELLARSPTLQE